MNASTRDFPAGDIRVSDADRDRALTELSEHFQTGRLTQEEFEDRSGRALAARTGDELRGLFADLPPTAGLAAKAGQAASAPAGAPSRARCRWTTGRIIIACVIAATVVGNVIGDVVGNVGHNGAHSVSLGWLVPVVILLCVFRCMHRR